MRRGYGEPAARRRHPRVGPLGATGTADLVGAAVAVAIAVATRWWYVPIAAGSLAAVVRSGGLGAVVAVLTAVAVWRADSSWAGLQPDELGPFDGWATVVGEPAAGGRCRSHRARRRRRALRGVGARPRPPAAHRAVAGGRPGARRGRTSGAEPVSSAPGRVAARGRRARRRLARRRRARHTGGGGVQPRARADPPRRRRAARRAGGAGARVVDRRRPGRAAGDGRPLPRRRARPPHRGVRAERGAALGRRRAAAAAGPAADPVGRDVGA